QWDSVPKNKVYQKVEFQGVDDLELDNDGPAGGIYQKFENKLQDGTIEKSIQVWIRLTPYVKRTEWTNCFFLGQNQEFNDNSYLGDRSLTLYVIDNILHFPTYDLNTKKVNYNQNLNFEQSEEGKWCLIYFGYSHLQQKAFVYSQFQGSQAKVLNYNGIRHKSSNIYHLFVGQRPSYKNFPGRIVNLIFCGGSGCYREDGFNQQWDSVPKNKLYQKFEFQGANDLDLDQNEPDAGTYQKFENKLQAGTIEKSIQVWIRLTPYVKRTEWTNCFFLGQNQEFNDNSYLGDRSLTLYVINNMLHFPTYDYNSQTVNYAQNINFEQSEEGKWCLIYFGYSDLQQKAFVYIQFQGSEPKVLNYNGIKHKSSDVYHLFVGQAFQYKNFPGRIINLQLCGGSECYREEKVEQVWDKFPKYKIIQKVEILGADDLALDYYDNSAGTYQKYENRFQADTIEKSISVWIRLTPSIKRSELANCFLLSQNSQLQDNAVLGDQSLALYVINNVLQFSTYDLNTQKVNYSQNINFEQTEEGKWCFIYFGYSEQQQKVFIHSQFQGSEPKVLNFNGISHKSSDVYHLFVGQAFSYKNFPGRIVNLLLCGGYKCYQEDRLEQVLNNVPQNKIYSKVEFKVLMILNQINDGPAGGIYQKFENRLQAGSIEKSIQVWIRLTPYIKRTEWTNCFFLGQNQEFNDNSYLGDRSLTLYVINNMLHFPTYDYNSQTVNYAQNINFEQSEEGKWCLIYFGYSDLQQKAFVYSQFQGSQANVLNYNGISHKSSNIYHLFVGQAFTYKNFPGRIVNLIFCGGSGCYREDGFNQQWDSVPKNKLYQKVEFQGADDLELDNDGPAGGIYQKFENKLQAGTIEKSIQVWIRLTPYVKRTEWTNCFFLGQNQEFNDNSYLGDRSLTLYVINNMLHFPTYDYNSQTVNYAQNINFEQSEEGKWCLIYFGYSDLQQKAFVYSQFQGSQANVLNYNGIRHKSSNIYHLFVGQRPSYKNFPGRIVNLVFCGGSGCYREDGFEQVWNKFPKYKIIQKVEILGADDLALDYYDNSAGTYQKYENRFQADTIEKSISVWIRLTPSIKRSELANCFLLSQNSQLQDNAVLGDQSLALYVINNVLQFSTYDLNTQKVNYSQNINFEQTEEGKWCFIYFGYSEQQQKVFIHSQFQGSEPKVLNFNGISHKSSDVYHLFVGQAFSYKNFPGRIVNLLLCGGYKCYQEEGFKLNLSNVPQNKIIQRLEIQGADDLDLDYNGPAAGTYQKYENKLQAGMIEKSIQVWIKLTPYIKRSDLANCFLLSQNSQLQDNVVLGDQSLALYIINNNLQFSTYDQNSQKINYSQNIIFEQSDEGKWCLIYFGYSDLQQKAFIYTQFQGSHPRVLNFNGISHKSSYVYHLFVGQSFSYKNFPGRIVNLVLCGGSGCYKQDEFDQLWNNTPQEKQYPQVSVSVLSDQSFDENSNGLYNKYENKFNGIQEFSIQCWIRIHPNSNRENMSTVYHLNQNQDPKNYQQLGDRVLSLFVINNTLHFSTYDYNTNNVNSSKQVTFENQQIGVWALIYHTYTPDLQKAYIHTQFQGSNPVVIHYPGISHSKSNVYHLWVGQSFIYKVFPGRIINLNLCGGTGCYREKDIAFSRNFSGSIIVEKVNAFISAESTELSNEEQLEQEKEQLALLQINKKNLKRIHK
ncbi:hypothetical protein IMG5_168110, partial [Ichthyophthirius multifiliis]